MHVYSITFWDATVGNICYNDGIEMPNYLYVKRHFEYKKNAKEFNKFFDLSNSNVMGSSLKWLKKPEMETFRPAHKFRFEKPKFNCMSSHGKKWSFTNSPDDFVKRSVDYVDKNMNANYSQSLSLSQEDDSEDESSPDYKKKKENLF